MNEHVNVDILNTSDDAIGGRGSIFNGDYQVIGSAKNFNENYNMKSIQYKQVKQA